MYCRRKKVSVEEINPQAICDTRKFGTPTMVLPKWAFSQTGKTIPEITHSDIPPHAATSPTQSARLRHNFNASESTSLLLPLRPTAIRTLHANPTTNPTAI